MVLTIQQSTSVLHAVTGHMLGLGEVFLPMTSPTEERQARRAQKEICQHITFLCHSVGFPDDGNTRPEFKESWGHLTFLESTLVANLMPVSKDDILLLFQRSPCSQEDPE